MQNEIQSFLPTRPCALAPALVLMPCPASLSSQGTGSSWTHQEHVCSRLLHFVVSVQCPESDPICLLGEAFADHPCSKQQLAFHLHHCLFSFLAFFWTHVFICLIGHCLLPPWQRKLPEGRGFVCLSHCSSPTPYIVWGKLWALSTFVADLNVWMSLYLHLPDKIAFLY